MDKYDEKAQAMIGHYPPSLPAPCPEECLRCERVAFTAHAMRESAAEAFEEAAKSADEWEARPHCDEAHDNRWCSLCNDRASGATLFGSTLFLKAAALRSTTRGKGA